jgi:phosphoribosylformylglycinamidine synthase
MKSAVVVFPGINRERDMMLALRRNRHSPSCRLAHRHGTSKVDLIVVPGGFSYGDTSAAGRLRRARPS